MSNKPHEQLMPLDKLLRRQYPIQYETGGGNNCKITITFQQGFELFNTRPYHNYENWSDGYYITLEDAEKIIHASGEDLDEALHDLFARLSNPRPHDWRIKSEIDNKFVKRLIKD